MISNRILRYLFFFFYISCNLALAEEKIVYVDLQKMINNSIAGKSINSEIEKQNKKMIDKFNTIENDLRIEESKLLAQKKLLEKSEFEKKIALLQKKINDYKDNKQKDIRELNDNRIKAKNLLFDEITIILTDYAESNKVSFIMDKKNIIMGKKDSDITDLIEKTLNNKIKKIKIN